MSHLPTKPSPDAVEKRFEETETVRAVLRTSTWRGPWQPPEAMRVVSILGSVVLDYRDADLPPGVTELDCAVYLGSVEILLPPDVDLELTGSVALGSVETRGGWRRGRRRRRGAEVPERPEDDERPLLSVDCSGALGSVEITLA